MIDKLNTQTTATTTKITTIVSNTIIRTFNPKNKQTTKNKTLNIIMNK